MVIVMAIDDWSSNRRLYKKEESRKSAINLSRLVSFSFLAIMG